VRDVRRTEIALADCCAGVETPRASTNRESAHGGSLPFLSRESLHSQIVARCRAARYPSLRVDDFFYLTSKEFEARSGQIRRLVRQHGPSVGAAHEVILRRFLRDYLPRSLEVGHGFIRTHAGHLSAQTDILIYTASHYAPLYRVDDFVILPPEAVVAAIEVKTSVTRADFVSSMHQLARSKSLATEALIGMFIFHPVKIATFERYIAALKFEQQPSEAIPDLICGIGQFYVEKASVVLSDESSPAERHRPTHVGYMQHIYAVSGGRERDYTFEVFFYRLYQHIEMAINRAVKGGIDNVWHVLEDEVRPHGRVRYSDAHFVNVKLLGIVRHARGSDGPGA
jgi:hypothetical protein